MGKNTAYETIKTLPVTLYRMCIKQKKSYLESTSKMKYLSNSIKKLQ